MTDGVLLDGSGVVKATVLGWSDKSVAPDGQTFHALPDLTGVEIGQTLTADSATAAGMLAEGISVTSTGGNFTATFEVGGDIASLILGELTALQLSSNAAFADGAATVAWPDASGTTHSMDPTQFIAFARAVGAYVAKCRNVRNGVSGATLPAANATIP